MIATILGKLVNFYEFLIIVYCLLSWFPRGRGGFIDDLSAVLESICGPFLNIFRRFIPAMGGIDFSPVIAIVVLNLIEGLVMVIIL